MDKVIRDGKVAVLYSPGYGAGWFSWNSGQPELLFDPDIVVAVEADDLEKAAEIAKSKWPDGYYGGHRDLTIEWITVGTAFEIHEYDGFETVQFADRDWIIA